MGDVALFLDLLDLQYASLASIGFRFADVDKSQDLFDLHHFDLARFDSRWLM